MTYHFTIIQYVPDPVANERINIGVMVFGEGKVFTRFVSNWAPIRRFGGEDINFLRDFASDLQQIAQTKLSGERVSQDSFIKMTAEWGDSIQFTRPLPSTEHPEHLLISMAKRVLRGEHGEPPTHRTKSQVVRHVHRSMATEITSVLGPNAAGYLVASNLTVFGAATYHNPDLVVRNGAPIACLFCLSFNISGQEMAMASLMASVCAINDIKKKNDLVECAVVAALPEEAPPKQLVERAVNLVHGAGGVFLPEQTEDRWVREFVRERLAPYLENHGGDWGALLTPPPASPLLPPARTKSRALERPAHSPLDSRSSPVKPKIGEHITFRRLGCRWFGPRTATCSDSATRRSSREPLSPAWSLAGRGTRAEGGQLGSEPHPGW